MSNNWRILTIRISEPIIERIPGAFEKFYHTYQNTLSKHAPKISMVGYAPPDGGVSEIILDSYKHLTDVDTFFKEIANIILKGRMEALVLPEGENVSLGDVRMMVVDTDGLRIYSAKWEVLDGQ